MPGRVEDGCVQFKRLADPVAELGMVGKVVVGQRMDERAEACGLYRRDDVIPRRLMEMNLELRDWMRADTPVGHLADEEDFRATGKPLAQRFCSGPLLMRIINMGVIWCVVTH